MRFIHVFMMIALLGCPMSDSETPEQVAQDQLDSAAGTRVGVIGAKFAGHLVAGDFERAAEMLAPPLRARMSPMELESRYDAMLEYAGAQAESIQPVTTMRDWPGKQPGDRGWVYVAINGLGFSEAVALIITDDDEIREIEWGRP